MAALVSNIAFFFFLLGTLNSHLLYSPISKPLIAPLHTQKGVKHCASLWYCTTQDLHHITPWAIKKGEKQQQLSGKRTVILPKRKKKLNNISKESGLMVKIPVVIVIVTVACLLQKWTRGINDLFRLGHIKAGRPTVLLPKTSLFLFPF